MLKSIIPLAALAIAFIPSSANADLRQQYNEGGCKKYYRYINFTGKFAGYTFTRCIDSRNNVWKVWDHKLEKRGVVDKASFRSHTTYPKIYQYHIENNNLIEYECDANRSTQTCSGEIDRSVYIPIDKSDI